jgi:hypothetical protein
VSALLARHGVQSRRQAATAAHRLGVVPAKERWGAGRPELGNPSRSPHPAVVLASPERSRPQVANGRHAMEIATTKPHQQAAWAAGDDAAGFAGVDVLAIDNPFWRLYRLRE